MTTENQKPKTKPATKALPSSTGSLAKGGDFYNGIEWMAAWMVDNVEVQKVSEEKLRVWATKAWLQHIEKQNGELNHE